MRPKARADRTFVASVALVAVAKRAHAASQRVARPVVVPGIMRWPPASRSPSIQNTGEEFYLTEIGITREEDQLVATGRLKRRPRAADQLRLHESRTGDSLRVGSIESIIVLEVAIRVLAGICSEGE